jgi:hypothetical protein
VSQTIQRQIIGEVVTNELEVVWKKWALARYPDSYLEEIS